MTGQGTRTSNPATALGGGFAPTSNLGRSEERKAVALHLRAGEVMTKTKPKHTPSPWGLRLCANQGGAYAAFIVKPADREVDTEVIAWITFMPEHEANARLIAAAPDYDTNGRRFVARMAGATNDAERVMIAKEEAEAARAAIARAEEGR